MTKVLPRGPFTNSADSANAPSRSDGSGLPDVYNPPPKINSAGEQTETKVPTEVYSRIVGYLRPVSSWNIGKRAEFTERVPYDPALNRDNRHRMQRAEQDGKRTPADE